MELGLLNLMSAGGLPEEAGPAGASTIDGDAFTKLIAQLGIAPAAPAEISVTDGATPVVPGAALLALLPAMRSTGTAQAKPADGDVATDATSDADQPADVLDVESLGLPPLLAALMATPSPTAAPAPTAAGSIASGPDGNLTAALVSTSMAEPTALAPAVPVAIGVPQAGEAKSTTPAKPVSAPDLAPKGQRAAADLSLGVAVPSRRPEAVAPPTHDALVKGPSSVDRPTLPAVNPAASIAPVLPLPATTLIEVAPTPVTVEPARAAEIILERQLDLAHDGEWLDQLAKDIARTAGDGQLRFKLNPEHLGTLHVELTQGASGASVRLTADTEASRTIIADARPQLIAEARAQGVRIAEAHVDLGSGSQSSAGHGQRDGRELPEQAYLTSWKAESAEEEFTSPRRSTSERYA